MDKSDKILRRKFGSKVPFRVPDAYFENFTNDFMDKIPKQKARILNIRPWWYHYRSAMLAAACFCGISISFGVYFHKLHISNEPIAKTHIESASNNTIDQMADYTMLDNEEIYASLVDNQ